MTNEYAAQYARLMARFDDLILDLQGDKEHRPKLQKLMREPRPDLFIYAKVDYHASQLLSTK